MKLLQVIQDCVICIENDNLSAASFLDSKIWLMVVINFIDMIPWIKALLCIEDVVQSLSHFWLFMTPWTAAQQAPLSANISEFAQSRGHCVSDAI